MAANISITQGAGTTMRTDENGSTGVHTQIVRMSYGNTAKEASHGIPFLINASSSGDNTLVALIASTIIRVVSIYCWVSGAVNFKFKSGASTDLTGLVRATAEGGVFAAHFNPEGHFQTAAGEALVVNLSGAITLSGWGTYITEA